jgi:hypothetical protein
MAEVAHLMKGDFGCVNLHEHFLCLLGRERALYECEFFGLHVGMLFFFEAQISIEIIINFYISLLGNA